MNKITITNNPDDEQLDGGVTVHVFGQPRASSGRYEPVHRILRPSESCVLDLDQVVGLSVHAASSPVQG
jgi:hypothetical protein